MNTRESHLDVLTEPAPVAGKITLWGLTTLAGAIGLIAAFYCLLITSWSVSSPVDGTFTFHVPVAAPAESTNVFETQFSTGQLTAGYDGSTWISSDEPLIRSRILSGLAAALPFIIVVTGCVGAIVLARKLRRRAPFTPALRRVLGVLGGLTALSAICIPWFESFTAELAVSELGLPTDSSMVANPDTDAWVVPGGFDLLQDLNWPLFLLGIVLILVSALLSRAIRLQHETEGLI